MGSVITETLDAAPKADAVTPDVGRCESILRRGDPLSASVPGHSRSDDGAIRTHPAAGRVTAERTRGPDGTGTIIEVRPNIGRSQEPRAEVTAMLRRIAESLGATMDQDGHTAEKHPTNGNNAEALGRAVLEGLRNVRQHVRNGGDLLAGARAEAPRDDDRPGLRAAVIAERDGPPLLRLMLDTDDPAIAVRLWAATAVAAMGWPRTPTPSIPRDWARDWADGTHPMDRPTWGRLIHAPSDPRTRRGA